MKLSRAQHVLKSLEVLKERHQEQKTLIASLDREVEEAQQAPTVIETQIKAEDAYIQQQECFIRTWQESIRKAEEAMALSTKKRRDLYEKLTQADQPLNLAKKRRDNATAALTRIEKEQAKLATEETHAKAIIDNINAREMQRQKVEDAIFAQFCIQRDNEKDESVKKRMTDGRLRQQAKIKAKEAIARAQDETNRAMRQLNSKPVQVRGKADTTVYLNDDGKPESVPTDEAQLVIAEQPAATSTDEACPA